MITWQRLSTKVFRCPSWTYAVPVYYDGGYSWNGVLGWDDAGTGGEQKRKKLTTLRRLAETILVSDCMRNITQGYQGMDLLYTVSPGWASGDISSPKHKAGWNITWLDGHASYKSRAEILIGKPAPGSRNNPAFWGDYCYYFYPKTI
jgi:hypothetical protein